MLRPFLLLSFLACVASSASAQEDTLYTRANANLRESPTMSAAVLRVLPRGTAVAARCDGEWCRVATRSGQRGYVSRSLLRGTRPPESRLSDAEVRRILIRRSIDGYSGSCPCPYNTDRGGRRCGRRSAYSRPGGAAPLCYARDVSDAMVRRYREREDP